MPPRYAVCWMVLNLQICRSGSTCRISLDKQRLSRHLFEIEPIVKVLVQNLRLHHKHSRVPFLYHKFSFRVCVSSLFETNTRGKSLDKLGLYE